MMSLGLCICDSCEGGEKCVKRYSKKESSLQEQDLNCKSCCVDKLQQKKISSEMKTKEPFYN